MNVKTVIIPDQVFAVNEGEWRVAVGGKVLKKKWTDYTDAQKALQEEQAKFYGNEGSV